MRLRLHHIEICVKDPIPVIGLLCNQFGLNLVGQRETSSCMQYVLRLAKTAFVITSRKGQFYSARYNNDSPAIPCGNKKLLSSAALTYFDKDENWSLFCCKEDQNENHIDSVFNVAVEVENLAQVVQNMKEKGAIIVKDIARIETSDGVVEFAVIKSCCGNVVHTVIQKNEYRGWFLPGFCAYPYGQNFSVDVSHIQGVTMSHFDHFTLACRIGETNQVMDWYEKMFEMKRFLTNRQDSVDEGIVIPDDVGMRLKVMEFWKCSEAGLASENCDEKGWEPLKIVIVESLPNISNTQIRNFLLEHGGPGIQHIGLLTENMIETVRELTKQGVRFRHPPPTYYTEIGQLKVIDSAGEDVATLRQYGILLDDEADVFDDQSDSPKARYLMQVFTHPIFNEDTFFLEVINRRGARGFGVGNVTALARSVNAYQEELQNREKLRLREGTIKQEDNFLLIS